MGRRVVIAAILLLGIHQAWDLYAHRPLARPPGVLVTNEPQQREPTHSAPIVRDDFTLQPLADFEFEARVLLVSRYRVPEPPRLAFADLVATYATGSIDVSDGLVADAGHVAEASGVRLVIRSADVPLSPAANFYVTNEQVSLQALLTGGDDYQTLFAAPASARDAIARTGQIVTRIGTVEQSAGVKVLDASGADMPFDKAGWKHFSRSAEA